jgi:hypothetical protein
LLVLGAARPGELMGTTGSPVNGYFRPGSRREGVAGVHRNRLSASRLRDLASEGAGRPVAAIRSAVSRLLPAWSAAMTSMRSLPTITHLHTSIIGCLHDGVDGRCDDLRTLRRTRCGPQAPGLPSFPAESILASWLVLSSSTGTDEHIVTQR